MIQAFFPRRDLAKAHDIMIPTSGLNVGIIGTGDFAQTCHIPGIRSHPHARIVAICGRRLDVASSLARRLEIPRVHRDYQALCLDPEVDAVTIATPNALHAEQALFALAQGKHVFCEKPLGTNVAEAERMFAAAQASGRVHMVSFTYRYCYGVQHLRQAIRAGMIGTPHYLRVQYDSWEGVDPAWAIGWREDLRLAGGGLLFDRGSHLFDLARFILGPLDCVTGFHHLVAKRQRPVARLAITRDVETDDMAAAWFRHVSGARGQWFASRASPPFAQNSFVQVVGPEGALQAAISRGTVDSLHLSRPPVAAWTELPLPPAASDGTAHALSRMMHSFVDACRAGRIEPDVDASFEDGLAAQQAIDAVLRETQHPAWVRLPR